MHVGACEHDQAEQGRKEGVERGVHGAEEARVGPRGEDGVDDVFERACHVAGRSFELR